MDKKSYDRELKRLRAEVVGKGKAIHYVNIYIYRSKKDGKYFLGTGSNIGKNFYDKIEYYGGPNCLYLASIPNSSGKVLIMGDWNERLNDFKVVVETSTPIPSNRDGSDWTISTYEGWNANVGLERAVYFINIRNLEQSFKVPFENCFDPEIMYNLPILEELPAYRKKEDGNFYFRTIDGLEIEIPNGKRKDSVALDIAGYYSYLSKKLPLSEIPESLFLNDDLVKKVFETEKMRYLEQLEKINDNDFNEKRETSNADVIGATILRKRQIAVDKLNEKIAEEKRKRQEQDEKDEKRNKVIKHVNDMSLPELPKVPQNGGQ